MSFANNRDGRTPSNQEIQIQITHPIDWINLVTTSGKKDPNVALKIHSSKEMQVHARVSKTQLIHWTERGVILPLKDAKGRGGRRVYSHKNLIEAIICRELNKLSVETRLMKDILHWLNTKRWVFIFEQTYSMELDPEKTIRELVEADPRLSTETKANYKQELFKILHDTENMSFKRTHTVWEFLELYHINVANFFLAIRPEYGDAPKDETGNAFPLRYDLYGLVDLLEITEFSQSLFTISFRELMKEAGSFHE